MADNAPKKVSMFDMFGAPKTQTQAQTQNAPAKTNANAPAKKSTSMLSMFGLTQNLQQNQQLMLNFF